MDSGDLNRLKKRKHEVSQPLRRSTREIVQKPVQTSPPLNRKNIAVKKIKQAKKLDSFVGPWNILKEEEISLIVKKLDTEDGFCLEEAYPGTRISRAIQNNLSEQKGLYLIMDPYVYEKDFLSPYGVRYPSTVGDYYNAYLNLPSLPLITPLMDLELNEEKCAVGYNTLINITPNNIQKIFPAVRTLKIVMRSATAEWLKDLCVVLSMLRNQLVSLQIFIGDYVDNRLSEDIKDKAAIELCNLLSELNTKPFPELRHLLLDVDENVWGRCKQLSEIDPLILLGQVEEFYLRVGTEFINQHFDLVQSNGNLKKFGVISYKFTSDYLCEELIRALISRRENLAKKIFHVFPLMINIATFPQFIDCIHLFTELTHFNFEVTVTPGKKNYFNTLNAIKDLRNLQELYIELSYKVDADFEKSFFQLLRLPHVKVLKLKCNGIAKNINNYYNEIILDHNILNTLSVTRQFPNLKTFYFNSVSRCSICKCRLVDEKLNCYNQLIQPVTNLYFLEEFKGFCNTWYYNLDVEFKEANTRILQTIIDRREADRAAAAQQQQAVVAHPPTI